MIKYKNNIYGDHHQLLFVIIRNLRPCNTPKENFFFLIYVVKWKFNLIGRKNKIHLIRGHYESYSKKYLL